MGLEMMKGREFAFLAFNVGSGIAVEALLFWSPLFEMILWETMCSCAKVIPLAKLVLRGVIGLALLLTALLFVGVLVQDILTRMRRSP
jgi:hypothetical protein